MTKPLALTMGDPGGIGPDIAIKAWLERTRRGVPPFLLLASPELIRDRAERLGVELSLVTSTPAEAVEIFSRALPVLPLKSPVPLACGTASVESAAAVIEAIDRGVDLTISGAVAAVVTNPIAKEPLLKAGFPHPGHTDYLGVLAAAHTGTASTAVMMLWSKELAVVPVTVHIPLAKVPAVLTADLIVETARITSHDLSTRFGIPSPRLAFCGLNPHAGEGGTLGSEEQDIIIPAIARLRIEGINASGPYPADTMFHADARTGYDAVIAMYHDQALIPLKTLAFDSGVNVTLGLPFVRTSPDHGTAFKIAGTGQAKADSLIEALKLADRIAAAAP
ncbi:4-hydroxythreonine-4-phosphate dehydrogenase [Agaricicola taiwanensis]|uniref:4-hydroxythreonine-4-phosphate dehydrogenase n=1 Tax=Agaricicola taiwanensis TaxID=591372 RepID=A0A8J3DV17_9RHOB|nr:4-hydroxythreonine-4-phosphate dehydrogenase PdxA [Agaricicola taiwanensis]GGE46865.1 4-hydroxythreonine-4-phosphate dehydrogenase [Agaricicola taiwanensis]